jgi:hypothetical protein
MANSTSAGVRCVPYSASDPDLYRTMQDTQCHGTYTALRGTADAIPFPGNILVTSAGINAMTLVAPLAGPQQNGGDDGKTIFVVAATAQAHTITTPANAILGSKHLATFAAAAGNNITLTAMNGVWALNGAALGVTVT